jgi:hypothetical protein
MADGIQTDIQIALFVSYRNNNGEIRDGGDHRR